MIRLADLSAYILRSRGNIAKFMMVGGSSTLLDMALLVLLKEAVGIPAVIAVAMSQVVVISYNFSLNKFWSFANRDLPLPQLRRYLLLLACNYTAAILLMYVFHELIGLHYTVVRLGSIALFAAINFLSYQHWVFKTA